MKPIFAAELWIAWAQEETTQDALLAFLDEEFTTFPHFFATVDDVIAWTPQRKDSVLRKSRLYNLAEGKTLSELVLKTANLLGKAATLSPLLEKQLGGRRQIS
ncbi:MAG: hypothetical protein GY822_29030 [Deltaproteobacteria bacterium]|nr:hypothetical protein [Deltaproteobacteria bacterium]